MRRSCRRIVGGQDERGVAIAQFPRQRQHLCIAQALRIQHDSGRIAGEALLREGVDLEECG